MSQNPTKFYCSVPGCSNVWKKGRDVAFHRYPKKHKLRVRFTYSSGKTRLMDRLEAWLLRVQPGKPLTSNMTVCSKHFKRCDYFNGPNKKLLLKHTAVPSLLLPPESLSEEVDPELMPVPTLRVLEGDSQQLKNLENKMNIEMKQIYQSDGESLETLLNRNMREARNLLRLIEEQPPVVPPIVQSPQPQPPVPPKPETNVKPVVEPAVKEVELPEGDNLDELLKRNMREARNLLKLVE